MGVPLAIIIMAALMMISFGIAAVWILKKNGSSLKQTIDPKPDQTFSKTKETNK